MKSRILTLLISSFIALSVFANPAEQDEKSLERDYNKAVAYSDTKQYDEAIKLFTKISKYYPENINVLYNLGLAYLNAGSHPDSAANYFKIALTKMPKEDYTNDMGIDLHLSLGKAYQMDYKQDNALDVYSELKNLLPEELEGLRADVTRQMEMCENALELMKHPVKLEVVNLGESINSGYDDHTPLVAVDESLLLFTSRRATSYSDRMSDNQYYEKVFISKYDNNTGWGKAKILTTLFERDGHEAGVALSSDATELYLYRNNEQGRNLYVSNFDGTNWGEPTKLPKPINSNYDETHASLNSDKSILLFTSNRPGGYGGMDIYQVRRLPNGEWSKAKNLGSEINSPFDEEAPRLHPDGKTLYFSSEGHNSMGNFDLFYSKLESDSVWSAPINMGYPINTPDDDLFFMPTAGKNRAYFASSRFEDSFGRTDLYLIEYEEPVEARLAVLRGVITDENSEVVEGVKVVVTEKSSNNLVGVFRPHPANGKYVLILEAGRTYDIKYIGDGYTENSMMIEVTRDMVFKEQQQTVVLNKTILENKEKKEMVALVDKDEDNGTNKLVSKKYTVQFLVLKEKSDNHKWFDVLEKELIRIYKCNDGKYRYVYGAYERFTEAKEAQLQLIEKSKFDDAFIRNEKQLEIMEVE